MKTKTKTDRSDTHDCEVMGGCLCPKGNLSGFLFYGKGGDNMPVEYIPLKGKDDEYFTIMEYIPRIAKDYGWTSGLFDENLANAIEKARNAPGDPYGCEQSLLTARYVYEAMQLARDPFLVDARAVRRLEKPSDLEL